MKVFLRKAKAASAIFVKGFVAQVESTIWIATAIGLYQGLKYGGSIARGVKTGVIVLTALGTATGVSDLLANRETINRA